jgi:hypothetical protein
VSIKAAIERCLQRLGYEFAEVWGEPQKIAGGGYVAVVAVNPCGPLVRMEFRRAAPEQLELPL